MFEYRDWGIEGFWICSDGKRIQTTIGYRHADIVLANLPAVPQEDADNYFSARERGDSSYDMMIVEHGLKAGWIRVLEPDSGELAVEYRPGISTKPAWSTLHRYVSRGIDNQSYLFSVPDGDSVELDRKVKALRFIGGMMQ